MKAMGITQSELGRRSGVTGSTINNLVMGRSRSSTHLHQIARALLTTPAYLEGEIDDPSASAAPPPGVPVLQYISLPVALPAEEAIAHALRRLLMTSRGLSEADLAREIARRLPGLLRAAQDAVRIARLDEDGPADT